MGPFGVILAVIFAPMAAMLIQMTISRTREYSADKLGAQISGNPLRCASMDVVFSNTATAAVMLATTLVLAGELSTSLLIRTPIRYAWAVGL